MRHKNLVIRRFGTLFNADTFELAIQWLRRNKEVSLLFDVLPAGHRVPHAGAREPLHVLHDDKGFLLQRDDGQVAVVQLGVAERVEARPHWVFKRKAAVVQFPHLEGTTEKEVTQRRDGASQPEG